MQWWIEGGGVVFFACLAGFFLLFFLFCFLPKIGEGGGVLGPLDPSPRSGAGMEELIKLDCFVNFVMSILLLFTPSYHPTGS